MYKLIATLTLLSACSIYPSANSAEGDEKDTQQQLSIIRSQNASASATATASESSASAADYDRKMQAALPPTQPVPATRDQTVQFNRIMEALAPVYGDEADQEKTAKIAQLISEYAGKLERSEFPARTARITEALTPVYGSMAKDIAPLIGEYAGPRPLTFMQRTGNLISTGIDLATNLTDNNNYLNRFSDFIGDVRFTQRQNRITPRLVLLLAVVVFYQIYRNVGVQIPDSQPIDVQSIRNLKRETVRTFLIMIAGLGIMPLIHYFR